MTRYHWLVFTLCTLGWSLNCLEQQLFVLQRTAASAELLDVSSHDAVVWGILATSVMLLGWATGGLFFGVLGDKYGRSRVMVWTILTCSLITGFSGLSVSFGDFLLCRFLAGLGIGGQFAVGVTLLAETMPDRVRPYALGFLQWFTVFGSMAGALISMGIDAAYFAGGLPYPPWRLVWGIGAFPAVLAWFVMRYLDEPEKWKLAVRDKDKGRKNAGSYRELFGPVSRRRTIFATILTSTGVIGLWGTMFFSADLYQSIGRRLTEERLKAEGTLNIDITMIGMLVTYPPLIDDTNNLDLKTLLGTEKNNGDVQYLFEAIRNLRERKRPITENTVADEAIHRWNLAEGKGRQTSAIPLEEVERRKAFFLGRIGQPTNILENSERACLSGAELWKLRRQELAEILQQIDNRTKLIDKETVRWGITTTFLLNIGALFGIFSFTMVTARLGRRLTFTIYMAASMLSVIGVFMLANSQWEIYLLVPIMGFFLPALFGGYTIYLPELFPTRIRSTAIALCFSVGYFIVACIYMLGTGLSARWIGAAMSCVFLIGIAAVWMLPETKGKPLPE